MSIALIPRFGARFEVVARRKENSKITRSKEKCIVLIRFPSSPLSRFTYTKAYKNLLNELGDQAGQHEVIAENLSTQVVHELNTLVKQLKDDRRKVSGHVK